MFKITFTRSVLRTKKSSRRNSRRGIIVRPSSSSTLSSDPRYNLPFLSHSILRALTKREEPSRSRLASESRMQIGTGWAHKDLDPPHERRVFPTPRGYLSPFLVAPARAEGSAAWISSYRFCGRRSRVSPSWTRIIFSPSIGKRRENITHERRTDSDLPVISVFHHCLKLKTFANMSCFQFAWLFHSRVMSTCTRAFPRQFSRDFTRVLRNNVLELVAAPSSVYQTHDCAHAIRSGVWQCCARDDSSFFHATRLIYRMTYRQSPSCHTVAGPALIIASRINMLPARPTTTAADNENINMQRCFSRSISFRRQSGLVELILLTFAAK